jgi:hypothetical protein
MQLQQLLLAVELRAPAEQEEMPVLPEIFPEARVLLLAPEA